MQLNTLKAIIPAMMMISLQTQAQAKSLDEARGIAGQIEQATGGKIQILGDKINDDLFSDDRAIQNLNEVLEIVLHTPGLASMPAEAVGTTVKNALGLVTQYPEAERKNSDPRMLMQVNGTDAKDRFCALAAEPCNLFSQQISVSICAKPRTSKGPNDLLRN